MAINKGKYLLVILMLAFTTGIAQMSVPYSMSPIISSTAALTSNGGSPIVMSGNGPCLVVTSGLSTMVTSSNGHGVFGAGCVEKAPVATVLVSLTSLNVYPNPTHGISILKCEGKFDANLSGRITIMGFDGRTMMSQVVPMKEVQAGYQINAAAYAAGTYVISLDFMNQHYTVKLIKL